MDTSKHFAEKLDRADKLRKYREEFFVPRGKIYLDGNSLGLCSVRAQQSLIEIVNVWKTMGIDGWLGRNHPWFYLAEQLAEGIAKIIGASPNEVIVTGSTTVNLHQLLTTFYRPDANRYKILIDELAFPSDAYAVQSQLRLHGYDPKKALVVVKSRDGRTIEEDDIIASMSREVAFVVLPTVLYRSGQLLDIVKITKAAHVRGVLVGFDACHSIGVVQHSFHRHGVDVAFFCTYKYVNGGPGSVAGLYVHKKHLGRYPGLAGWFSSRKDKQFDMRHEFEPAETAGAYQIGTPHILSMAPLIGSLDLFSEVGIERIRNKSLMLTQYLMDLIESELSSMGFSIGTPREDDRRGGHVALEHAEALRICKVLKQHGVVPDFRPPNVIRLAPVPLYVSYEDVFKTVQTIKYIMKRRLYLAVSKEKGVVT